MSNKVTLFSSNEEWIEVDLPYKCVFICWKLKTAFYPKEDLEVVEERKAE